MLTFSFFISVTCINMSDTDPMLVCLVFSGIPGMCQQVVISEMKVQMRMFEGFTFACYSHYEMLENISVVQKWNPYSNNSYRHPVYSE